MVVEPPNRDPTKAGVEQPSRVQVHAAQAVSTHPDREKLRTGWSPAYGDSPSDQLSQVECDLIRRICAGESELFMDLVHPYQKMVYTTAISVVRNEHDAEEVAQEALFKAFKNLKQFRGECKFSTWIVQIAMNEARLRLRRRKRAAEESIEHGIETEEGDYVPIDFADWREIPSEILQRKELRQVLEDAISSLKPIYRDVLVLRDVQHLSVAETAVALGISEALVKTRLLRARFQVRDLLAPGFDGHWNVSTTGHKRVRPF
jgi:RNA polymerase sigma-70 factor (ECF subfamily)